MNADDLIILTLTQLGFLKNDDQKNKISSISQLSEDLFREILYKVINKIIQAKNLEVTFPEKPSYEMNKRFQEAQKSVEILKSLGYRGDIKMNSILHPEKRDKERILEFTLEIISSEEVGAHEIAEGMTEKNMVKMKIEKKLVEWQKDLWLIPELTPNPRLENKKDEFFLKISEVKTKDFKQIIKNSNIDNDYITAGKEAFSKCGANENIEFIQEEENQLSKYNLTEKNHNYLVNKLKKRKAKKNIEKNINQELIEFLDKRADTLQFVYSNYSENNFQNNVNILKKRNKEIYFSQIGLTGFSSLDSRKKAGENGLDENQNLKDGDNTQQFKNKLDAIINNFEEEKKAKNEEINELNAKLLNITNSIDSIKKSYRDNAELKNQLQETLNQLSEENTELLKEIEDQMNALEQMKKLQKNEMVEKEVVEEVEKLEKKYQDMLKDWADYSSQAKNQIQELKSSIDEKKKEYKYKFDQINALKKEIEEIANKIAMKQEIAQFLKDEYSKITVNINRNNFVNKISDLTKNIMKERKAVSQYIEDLKKTDKTIETYNATIKTVDNELEDLLYKDAKSNNKLKDVYSAYMKLREGYNNCQKNIIEVANQKHKLDELTNQVDDYKEKIKNYDIKQLNEQIELLKKANQGK
jgi:mediator of RNA polymerase II transcription subunit 21